MKKQIRLHDRKVEYTLRKSRRSKNMRLAVYADASFVVSAPRFVPQLFIERFIQQKAAWIIEKIDYFTNHPGNTVRKNTKQEYLKLKDQALVLAKEKVERFNQFYNFTYNKVAIKNQKTRWGSCSKKGNLNFNYKIVLLPEEQVNYLIVHELCHLREFNHSSRFWGLVSQTIPNYVSLRNKLKNK